MKLLYLRLIVVFSLGSLCSYAQVLTSPMNFYVIGEDDKNELHWDANPGAEMVTSYKIYRSMNKTTFALLNTSTTPNYIDNNVDNGTIYFYKVTAINTSGEGSASVIDAGVPESKFGKFLRVNGTESDTIWVNNSDELQLNPAIGSSFTIEFWLRVRALPLPGNEGYIIGRYTNTDLMRYVVRLRETGKIEFHTTNLTTGISSNTTIAVNKWYHIAVTYIRNGTTPTNSAKIFINGVQDKTSTTMQSTFSSIGGKVIFGGDPVATNRFLDGYVDEMRIWNVERTQVEIANNKCVSLRGDESGLEGLWHFDESGNTSSPMIYDYHKSGNNGGNNVKTMLFTPKANDDVALVTYNTLAVVKVQKNDIVYSKTKLITKSILSGPLHGSAIIINNDSIKYTPAPGFSGLDVIKYVLADTTSFCNSVPQYDTATLYLQVECSAKDNLVWAEVSEGAKSSKEKFVKKGLSTTLSSKNKGGVSSSMKVGKKFKNKSSLEWNAVGANATVSSDVSVAFNVPPDQFGFNILDIDKEHSDLVDLLVVSGYKDGSIVNLSTSNIISIGTAVTFIGNNSFQGIQNANDVNSTEGNISINYFATIDSVVLTFKNASPTAKVNGAQNIGIGDFSWCETTNNPPVIIDQEGNPATIIRATTPFNEPLTLCVSTLDIDSVYVTEIVPTQNIGVLATAAPDTCLIYTPKRNFIGEESFNVTWCDDRDPAMCTQVEVIITVLPPTNMLPFLISQALSPNGDNILDYWVIQGIERYPENNVKVFNVWGDLVYERDNYDNELSPWRGESNHGKRTGSQGIPDGTYYYIFNPGDGTKLLKGFVVLKR